MKLTANEFRKNAFLNLFVFFMALSCASASDNDPTPHHKTEILQEVNITIDISEIEKYRESLLTKLFETMEKESKEMLPFDEPIHEYGHQFDGRLRPMWEHAYKKGRRRFGFNGDWYYTITKLSAPFVPQVCADFVVDTIDRTAGTWYAPSLKDPKRVIGRFDMRSDMNNAGLNPRRVQDLITYFHNNNDKFEIVYSDSAGTGDSPRVGKTPELLDWLKERNVKLGDIILIRGKAPWDHGKEMHYHSLFVSSLDENKKVQKVFGNPAYPVERTIKVEMARAPKRKVVEIARLTNRFLKIIVGEK